MTASKATNSSSVMFWSNDHNIVLCREVLLVNPYKMKKGSTHRSMLWEKIAESLNGLSSPRFNVYKRSVRDHIGVLINRYKRKMRAEEKSTGITPDEPTELDSMLEEMIQLEESADMEQQEISDEKIAKNEKERGKAEDMRFKAMEKISDTTKRKSDEMDEKKEKRKRCSGNETILYLTQKADKDYEVKLEEIKMKKEQQELEEKKFQASVKQEFQFQQQQSELLRVMQQQQQQQQFMSAQMIMMQQQQEQSKALVSVLEKMVNK